MNLSAPKNSISLRKEYLQRKFFDALNLDDRKAFALLQSQWVHRYGLETLPDKKQLENLFIEEKEFVKSVESNILENDLSKGDLSSEVNNERIVSGNLSLDNKFKNEDLTKDKFSESISHDDETLPNNIDDVDPHIIDQSDLNPDESSIDNNKETESFNVDSGKAFDHEDQELEVDLDNECREEDIVFPAPPPPSLNNLRRWISTE